MRLKRGSIVMSLISAALASCNFSKSSIPIRLWTPFQKFTPYRRIYRDFSTESRENRRLRIRSPSSKHSWKVPETNVGDSTAPQDKNFEGLLIRYFHNALTAMLHESSTTSPPDALLAPFAADAPIQTCLVRLGRL